MNNRTSKLKIQVEQALDLRTGMKVAPSREYDHYEGPYEVTPAIHEQELATKTKLMDYDVIVFEIPYVETSNVFGTTVIIATN